MSSDYTERQTVGEQMRAEELSLRATIPPSEVPGYRLERLLGQGAFGQVWVGRNLNTGRKVAVKFYLHRGGVNWSLLSREVKHLVSMSGNRTIVQVLEVGWDAEPPYYVMEFLENGSLDDLIRSRGSLPLQQAVELFTHIATGLNHSHGKGVLHCDLKPANVLLDQDLHPRLADFGQSRMSHEQTPSLGTLFYMAPEQADLNAVPDARWDVYALGAILYCMLVGHPPYRTPQMVSTLDTAATLPDRLKRYRDVILRSPPPRQHYRVRGVDRALAVVIDRCLAKRPEDRWANVQQVLEALERRHAIRVRRPLTLLGIVGPLLLLGVMGLFSWRGITVAETESAQQLRDWSFQSNLFAAKFAARTLETEMANLFQLLTEETNRSRLKELMTDFQAAMPDEIMRRMAVPAPPAELRQRLNDSPEHNELQQYIEQRLKRLMLRTGGGKPTARFSSLLITDQHGTNLATAINEAMDESPVGRNFAYRSYFNGLREDQPQDKDRLAFQPITVPTVSAPFKSTTTERWKIAVSCPIYFDEEDFGVVNRVQGVMVLTINLGDFELLSEAPATDSKQPSDARQDTESRNSHRDASSRFAVLVNGREGTLLQHPLLKELDKKVNSETGLRTLKFWIDLEQMRWLKQQIQADYVDPVSRHSLGTDYSGKWIAAMQRVGPGRVDDGDGEEEAEATDLWVLVQERAQDVVKPVNILGAKLTREGLIALITLLLVISVLWYFVLRILRIPDAVRGPGLGRAGGDTGTNHEVTLGVD